MLLLGLGSVALSFFGLPLSIRSKSIRLANYKLHIAAVSLDGFTGDDRGLNILAVLCGIIYPLIGIGVFMYRTRFIK